MWGLGAKVAVACDLLFLKKFPHIRVPWSGRDVGRGESPPPISLLVQVRFPNIYPDGIVTF